MGPKGLGSRVRMILGVIKGLHRARVYRGDYMELSRGCIEILP